MWSVGAAGVSERRDHLPELNRSPTFTLMLPVLEMGVERIVAAAGMSWTM